MARVAVSGLVSLLFAVSAAGQGTPSTPLRVSELTYVHTPDANNPGSESAVVSFRIRNESAQAVVAYYVQVNGTTMDGSTRVFSECEADLTASLRLPATTRVAEANLPLPAGGVRNCRSAFGGKKITIPLSVAVTPVFVVLEDGVVRGDLRAAMANFFEPQRAMAKEYGRHVADLERIDRTSAGTILAGVAALEESEQRRGVAGTNGVKSRPELARDFASVAIATSLVGLSRMDPARITEGFGRDVAEMRRRYEIATRYSNPRPA